MFLKQLAGQCWRVFTYFLFPSERWHITQKRFVQGKANMNLAGSEGWGGLSFPAILLDCTSPPPEQNKELLSASGPKQEILSGITVMVREAIFVLFFLSIFCW